MKTSLSVEQVQALVARSAGKGVVNVTPAVTTVTYRKRFSWLWFILLLGVFYLLWWAVSKKDSILTVAHIASYDGTDVTLTYSGSDAKRASNDVFRAISGQGALLAPAVA